MGKYRDLRGQTFGRLTVIEDSGRRSDSRVVWLCRCSCGKETEVRSDGLLHGNTKSCGCLKKEGGEVKIKDLTGQQFGRLTVIEDTGRRNNGNVVWRCRCSCGKIIETVGYSLTRGDAKSCGCLRNERTVPANSTHGKTNTRLYVVWTSIKKRCFNPNYVRYKDYGGRGITICEEWCNDFQAFYEWSMANGYDPDAPRGQCTIDRIDNDKGYCPENCRFTDAKTQRINQRPRTTKTKKE